MPPVVHYNVQQDIAQLPPEFLGQTGILQSHVNTLEGYIHDMFGSMSGDEMKNLVQIINDMNAQITQMIT